VLPDLITEIVLEKGDVDFVLRELSQLPQKIQTAYVQQGNYWLTYFPTRGVRFNSIPRNVLNVRQLSAVFELAQAVALLYTWVRAKLFGRTPRQIREWCAPTPFDYSVYATNVLFMVCGHVRLHHVPNLLLRRRWLLWFTHRWSLSLRWPPLSPSSPRPLLPSTCFSTST
jgi:hypothetical protein